VKGYVPVEKLGAVPAQLSPMLGMPKMYQDMDLDPAVLAVATPPVMCWVCGEGFCSRAKLSQHQVAEHGGVAEYRKHLIWRTQEEGMRPLLPWIKRHMLSNFALFFSMLLYPRSGLHGVAR